jgi:hypothetical protein
MPETANRIESLFAAAVALPPAHGKTSICLARDKKCSRLLRIWHLPDPTRHIPVKNNHPAGVFNIEEC